MSFRKLKTVLTETAGSYVNGVWTPGTRSSSTILASVQPIDIPKDMQALPEGRHESDFVKAYTDTRLKVAADGEGVQPDIIVQEGYGYEIVAMSPNQSDVINHYKYVAAKIFKFTSTANWASGALARP